MAESTHIPQGKLTAYIKFIWCSTDYAPDAQKERVLPTGSSQLIINLGSDSFRHFDGGSPKECKGALVTGIHSHSVFLDSRTRTSTMGVVFRAGGVRALLGLPAKEFYNEIITLDDVINLDIFALRQRLIDAPDPSHKFAILDAFLHNLLDTDFQPNPAVLFAAQQVNQRSGATSIKDLTNEIGYSRRRLSQLFGDTVGTTPKSYARIQRFQQSLKIIRQCEEPDWTQIALSCGYYDQAHFNHDFKALADLTPTEYYRNQTPQTNHLYV